MTAGSQPLSRVELQCVAKDVYKFRAFNEAGEQFADGGPFSMRLEPGQRLTIEFPKEGEAMSMEEYRKRWKD